MKTNAIIPAKLKKGDQIRVIAPSRSLAIVSNEVKDLAIQKLEDRGYCITFGKHVDDIDEFGSSSVVSRASDLNEAFADKDVKCILTAIGGYNSNQLLGALDYSLIAENPKIFMGFSDITVLSNAIFAKTGLITYSGPHFSSWGMQEGLEYTEENFSKAVERQDEYQIFSSETWSDDPWYIDQGHRKFIDNEAPAVIRPGKAQGTLIGGNISSLIVLCGTEYFPDLSDSILFIEDDAEISPAQFSRMLHMLTLQKSFSSVRGLLIGRFQNETKMDRSLLDKIITDSVGSKNIPIIADLNFGHTTPIATLPVGGVITVIVEQNSSTLIVEKH